MERRSEHLTVWDGVDVAVLKERWQLPTLTIFDTVSSTNDVALDQAAAGFPDGCTVLADDRWSGRGRHGRRWHSVAGKNVLMSMVLPRFLASCTDVPARVAVATALALQHLLDSQMMMKLFGPAEA